MSDEVRKLQKEIEELKEKNKKERERYEQMLNLLKTQLGDAEEERKKMEDDCKKKIEEKETERNGEVQKMLSTMFKDNVFKPTGETKRYYTGGGLTFFLNADGGFSFTL